MDKADLLDIVVTELEARRGSLREIAEATGIPYDTVLRIKARESDPGYSRVRLLADHLGLAVAIAVPPNRCCEC